MALGLLALLTACSVGLFVYLMAVSQGTNQLSSADVFARKQLQAVVDRGLKAGSPPLAGALSGDYTLAVSEQAAAKYSYEVSAEPVESNLYYLQIAVSWNGQSLTGGGNTTRYGRLVHL